MRTGHRPKSPHCSAEILCAFLPVIRMLKIKFVTAGCPIGSHGDQPAPPFRDRFSYVKAKLSEMEGRKIPQFFQDCRRSHYKFFSIDFCSPLRLARLSTTSTGIWIRFRTYQCHHYGGLDSTLVSHTV